MLRIRYHTSFKKYWLLIYEIDHGELILYLTRTGTHSDLFKKKKLRKRKVSGT